ncbi:hypothetical protein B23_2945 [Geobacillus thermoleovorans B23]|nr:hypothetical protein B23_2945 [Geobacillus thermoleovorans B23]
MVADTILPDSTKIVNMFLGNTEDGTRFPIHGRYF